MSTAPVHAHQWDISFDGESEVVCKTCSYILDTDPLTSDQLIESVYTSAANIYYTVCFESDHGGPTRVTSFDLDSRLIALDILTANHYPKEIGLVKAALTALAAELNEVEYFRLSEVEIQSSTGYDLEINLGLDLRHHDNNISKALETFSYKILEEEGYGETEAKAYLALQNRKLVFKSYIDRGDY